MGRRGPPAGVDFVVPRAAVEVAHRGRQAPVVAVAPRRRRTAPAVKGECTGRRPGRSLLK